MPLPGLRTLVLCTMFCVMLPQIFASSNEFNVSSEVLPHGNRLQNHGKIGWWAWILVALAITVVVGTTVYCWYQHLGAEHPADEVLEVLSDTISATESSSPDN